MLIKLNFFKRFFSTKKKKVFFQDSVFPSGEWVVENRVTIMKGSQPKLRSPSPASASVLLNTQPALQISSPSPQCPAPPTWA